jgi:farnesol dehydrogenase
VKVLLTGATGFLGGRLAHTLAGAGHDVRAFVRDPARFTDAPAGCETAVGDVTHAASVYRAAEGCDAILHAAALVKAWTRDSRDFDRVNVDGLANAVEAARQQGARLLYVSSFIALGPTDGATFDESTPRAGTDFHNHYERTKWIADQMARRIRDVPLVRVYPGVVFGPGALTQGNHVVELLLQHARGKLPGLLGSGNLRQCFAYVEDVARGTAAALARGQPGSGYILGGENRTARELFAAFQAASGIAPPRRKVPFAVAALIGKLQRWRGALLGIEPELTDEVVGIYRHEWAYDSSLAERELGYEITPFPVALERTVAWLRENGELGG